MSHFFKFIAITALLFMRSCTPCPAADIDKAFEDKLVAAIYREEGGDKTRFKFGVEKIVNGVPYPFEHPEQVCRNTIEHQWRNFTQQSEQTDFIEFLGKTYAADPNWAEKVKRFL